MNYYLWKFCWHWQLITSVLYSFSLYSAFIMWRSFLMAPFKHPGDKIKLLLHSLAVPEQFLSALQQEISSVLLNHELQIFENHFYSLLLSYLCSQCPYAVHVSGITSDRENCSRNKGLPWQMDRHPPLYGWGKGSSTPGPTSALSLRAGQSTWG